MEPMTIAAIASGVISAAGSIYGKLSGNAAQEEAAEEKAAMVWAQRQEEIRQRKRINAQARGLATAGVYANNLQMSGSSERYVDELDMENMRQTAWAEQSARRERQAIRASAGGLGSSLYFSVAGDALGVASAVLADSGNSAMTDAEVDTALGAEQFDFSER